MGLDLSSLNEAQREAVECKEGNQLILAGPGTGKTRVIISKIVHLIETGTPASQILAMTFSKKATQEMEERLQAYLPEAYAQTEISTMHSWCVDLVQKQAFRLGLGKRMKLMTEAQAHLLFKQISHRLPLQPFLKSSFVDPIISDLLTFFQDCKDEGLWPEDILTYAQNLPEDSDDETKFKEEWLALGDIYNAFQNACFESGYMDFGDAILGAVRILEDHPVVRKDVQEQYRAILVDEFQDTNWTQIKLLRLIASESCHTSVVGDDDQSIYRFRGASYSAFQFFEELFSERKLVELKETYRLPRPVVEAASALISANGEARYQPNKKLLSRSDTVSPVKVLKAQSFEQEAHWVATQIKKLTENGVPASEIGVLVRAHNHADLFCQSAGGMGLNIQSLSTEALFDKEVVQDILAFLKLLSDPYDSVAFLRLLDSAFLRMGAEDIYEFISWAKPKKQSYLKLIESIEDSPLSDERKNQLKDFKEHYKKWSVSSNRHPCSHILSQFYEQSGVISYLMKNNEGMLSNLADFHRQLMEWESVQERKELKALYPLLEAISLRDIRLDEEKSTELDPNAVKVMSLHASKGLEFDHVFILSLVGRRLPGAFRGNTWMVVNDLRKEDAPTKETHLQEERRLVYVGMTRAKQQLYLTCVQKKGTKPSVFLTEDIFKRIEDPSLIEMIELPAPSAAEQIEQTLIPSFERTQATEKAEENPSNESLRLSFTQLDKYERCPLSYWFSYELKIPTTPTASLAVGSAVHSSLENFYSQVKRGQIPSKEELVEDFSKIIERDSIYNPNVTERDIKMASEKLEAYYDFHDGKFTVPIVLEKDFSLQIGKDRVSGQIDRVDPGSSKDSVVIIDYKTGKSKSNEKSSDVKFAKDSLQFSIYALAAKECFDWKVDELQFYYVYDNKTLSTTREQKQLDETKEKITAVADQIRSKDFGATPGMHCKFCEYNRICPEAKF